jgi:hypothetical protein
LQVTPSKKESKENVIPASSTGKKPSVLEREERSSPLKKKCLFNGTQSENTLKEGFYKHISNRDFKESERNDYLSHSPEYSLQSSHAMDMSPARKRQCIAGPSNFSNPDSRDCSLLHDDIICYQVDEEKENIGTLLDINSNCQGKNINISSEDKNIKRSDTWVIKWRNTVVLPKKTESDSSEADDQTVCEVRTVSSMGSVSTCYLRNAALFR